MSKPKVFRWNRWEKYEKKPVYRELTREEKERLRQQREQASQTTQPTQTAKSYPEHATKLNREKLADIITEQIKNNPEVQKLAEEIVQKVMAKLVPKITELVLAELVKAIQEAVLNGATVEIRGLATWKTKEGKVKVKNHIKRRQT
jgi:nucleoid DNA-binding protein